MNPIISAAIGIFFYGMSNVIFNEKLKFSTPFLITGMSVVTLFLGIVWLFVERRSGAEASIPKNVFDYLFIFLAAVCLFGGDAFYLSAYKLKGEIFSITTVAILLPLSIGLFTFISKGKLPNVWQLVGYVLATAALFSMAKGGKID